MSQPFKDEQHYNFKPEPLHPDIEWCNNYQKH